MKPRLFKSHRPLLDACRAAGLLAPVTERDLAAVFRVLQGRGIRHNLVGEPVWRQLMEVGR